MKYRNILPLIALSCIFLSSCNFGGSKPCFELICESLKQMDVVLAGEDVLISNCTDDGISFNWDFGDGTTSTLKSPHHVWETSGVYTVTLEVENEKGTKSQTQEVTVEKSLYGFWDVKILNDENEYLFTLDITQSANKIKGDFSPLGSNLNGVLSSNSQIAGDSVTLICTWIQIETMGDETYTFSSTYTLKGTVNETLDIMEGDQASRNTYQYDGWIATKRQ